MGTAIRGVGVVGGFGTGVAELRAALGGGSTVAPDALRRAQTERLEEFVPRRELRRVDHFSRTALLGAHLALQDANALDIRRDRVGVVVATGYGAAHTTFDFLDSVIDGGDPCASPTHFSNSVHNAAAAHISIFLKITGPSLTVSQFELSAASALLTASQWLEEGRVDAVLFGAVDEYCRVLGYCWQRYFGEPGSETPSPWELDRQTALPGEGAAFFLLGRDENSSASYCRLKNIELGVCRRGSLRFPEEALVILGADGNRRCGRLYRRLVPPHTRAASYAALFGSTPAAAGFDLAVGALSVRDGRSFAPPDATTSPWLPVPAAQELGAASVCCLKAGAHGAYGLVTLGRE